MRTESLLKKEFLRRKSKNPSYSLRAFSQSIDIPSGRLSEILNGKRRLTENYAHKILNNLKLDLVERKKWQKAIKGEGTESLPLDEAQFCLISDPIHYAILCLMETSGFERLSHSSEKRLRNEGPSLQVDWLARRLEKPRIEIGLALENLKTLQFISVDKGRIFLTLDKALETTSDIPSAALRESHRKSLLASVNKLDTVPVELRDITSMVMAIDLKNLPDAKRLIREFRKNLCAMLEDGNKDEVYELNVQLVPITQINLSSRDVL